MPKHGAYSPRERHRSRSSYAWLKPTTWTIHIEYHGEQRRIADLIAQAFGAIPGTMIPVFFNTYQRAFRTGRLRDALVHLSRPENGVRCELVTTAYWQPLVEAAELLGLDDDEAAQRCRNRLAVARLQN